MSDDEFPSAFSSVREFFHFLSSSSDFAHSGVSDADKLDSALISVADAFHSLPPSTSTLELYRAASFLCESHIRQIVQLLIVRDVSALAATTRLLLITYGLPGNDELVHDLIARLEREPLSNFHPSTLSLLAFLAGPALVNTCSISSILSDALINQSSAARLTLSIAFNVHPQSLYEFVPDVHSWDSQLPYADSPSFWRELKWAEFSRTKSVASGFNSSTSNSDSQIDTDFKFSRSLPSSAGLARNHFVRVCNVLMKRRTVINSKSDFTTSTSSQTQPLSFVVTPSIQPVLRNVSIALAHAMPFILEGPTGCGKTCLISSLARETTHGKTTSDAPAVTFVQMDSVARDGEAESFDGLIGSVVPLPEGGGFRWRPGPVGLAVERGEWLVLENIGRGTTSSASTSLLQRLANLRVGSCLEAPGRGEPICVSSGFRCIATRTVDNDDVTEDGWQPPGGWDIWLRLKMTSPSDNDIRSILTERFPHVADCIGRVVNSVMQVAAYTTRHSGPIFVHPNIRQATRICSRIDRLRSDGVNVTAEMAMQETLDTLVAWCADDRHCGKLVDIVAPCWSLTSDITKNLLTSFSPSYSEQQKQLQIGRATHPMDVSSPGSISCRLALNSHTLRLLERLLRCLQMKENVLLTGEAGSGKTAVVQELARLLGKKLVIVNLSRQSELSDLLGGFRPVEMAAIIPHLARRFEELFCSCMSRKKNLKFLDALQRSARTASQHERAVRLMKGVIDAIPQAVKTKDADISQRWTEIIREVESLERSFEEVSFSQSTESGSDESTQDRNSSMDEPPRKRSRNVKSRSARRVEFRFSEGVLVKAMRAGKWVLLDEINLAPSELLERLVSVVDTGQVQLSNENGDLISQTLGFMLFGAMNPPTDAGKRPLPSVLRSRFSELHVGDVKDIKDVTLLVLHRFFRKTRESMSTTREEFETAEDVAKFFIRCCELSKDGRIEDTAGKPVRFSMRTLSRMLDFANGVRPFFKPGFESTRRALYEGALVAFATSLPKICKNYVVSLANKNVLRTSKSPSKKRSVSTMMSISRNLSSSVHVTEGFPIEKNDAMIVDVDDEDNSKVRNDFIISPTVRKTLADICRTMLIGAPKYPVLLQGPTAAGKTSIVTYLAELTSTKLVRINNHEHTELSEYIGGYVVTPDGSLQFSEGPLVLAARHGHWVLLDELNLAPPDVLEALNRLLDDNREIFVAETGEVIKASPGFRLFATQNPPGLYGGRKELSRAFRSRFVEIHVDELPDADLLMILEKRTATPLSFAKGMVAVMRELQMHRRSTGLFTGREGYVTARDLFRWSSRNPRSREELAVYGFLLLGERARNPRERDVVRNVLVKALGVPQHSISDNVLYVLDKSEENVTASQECLDVSLQKLGLSRDVLLATLNEKGIVPTPHMCRMIVLIVHCMANQEPALLVGATGSGKTSCCDLICSALQKTLLSINCHRHTEASDIVGGFRPVRRYVEGGPLFEWCNGPLIEAMKNGSALLVDEINMADDAVIERLNSVLEQGRSFLLSEKGSTMRDANGSSSPDLVVADPGFLILATMNPGGDFGKKELSPALRNRFTEMWMPQPTTLADYAPIVRRRLSKLSAIDVTTSEKAQHIVLDFLKIVLSRSQLKGRKLLGSFLITLRDLKAWCDFIVDASSNCSINPIMALVHGARLVFLDGLSVGSMDNEANVLEQRLWDELLNLLPNYLMRKALNAKFTTKSAVPVVWNNPSSDICLQVDGFRLEYNPEPSMLEGQPASSFSFDAPNTLRNTARLCRATSVGRHPILLEGPPGGGKTSLVAALAAKAKFNYIRVNLSESTEMSDLIGSDAPGEKHGTFSFHEGPLLKALKGGGWLLLDELNLASQTVLEGLNSVLDHRRSVFVPELNLEVHAHESFRIFGAQNPAVEGSGRRGLPKSFLNRFTKVWIEPPDENDVLSIISSLHPFIPQSITTAIVSVLGDLKNRLDKHSVPWTFGLRDALRWCDILCEIGPFTPSFKTNAQSGECATTYMDECFDALVLQGLYQPEQKDIGLQAFAKAFGRPWRKSEWTPTLATIVGDGVRVGLSCVKRRGSFASFHSISPSDTTIFSSRISELQALSLSIQLSWATVFFSDSPSRSRLEGRRLFEILAVLSGKNIRVIHGGSLANGDDFVGGYSQQDVVWIVRSALRKWRDILGRCIAVWLNGNFLDSLAVPLKIISDILCLLQTTNPRVENCIVQDASDITRSFTETSTSILKEIQENPIAFTDCYSDLEVIRKFHSDLEDFLTAVNEKRFASFEWRKSSLLAAIEKGDWVFIEDADQCPPAVLDRLNPLFERLPIAANKTEEDVSRYPEKVLLAEAPTKDDGSPIYLTPHRDFRMAFSVSSGRGQRPNLGLSSALLDRSMRIFLGKTSKLADRDAVLSAMGLQTKASAEDVPLTGLDDHTEGTRTRLMASLKMNPRLFEIIDERTYQTVTTSSVQKISTGSPRTFPSDLIFNPSYAFLNRDLRSLFQLESVSSKLVDNVVKNSLSLRNAPATQEIFLHLPQDVNVHDIVRRVLVSTSAELFFISSSSVADAKLRLKILEDLGERKKSRIVLDSYRRVVQVAKKVVESVPMSSGQVENTALSYGICIDPVYSLDFGSVELLERNLNGRVKRPIQAISKEFRFQTLFLQNLLILWNYGQQTATWGGSRQPSLFAQAKLSHELREDDSVRDTQKKLNPVVLAYEIVETVVKAADQLCLVITKSNGWHSSEEEDYSSMLSSTISLCEILIGKCEFQEAKYLLTPLITWVSCWERIERAESTQHFKSFSDLKAKADPFINNLHQALRECGVLTMPKTKECQILEEKLVKSIVNTETGDLSVSAIDALSKAVVTVRTKDIEGNNSLLSTLNKLGESLKGNRDGGMSSKEPISIEHWTELTRSTALRAMWLLLFAFAKNSTCNSTLFSKHRMQSVLHLMKCIQPFHVYALFATQRMHWIMDSCEYEGVTDPLESINISKPFMSAVLRATSLLQKDPDLEAGEDTLPSGITHCLIKTTKDGSKNHFWNLGNAWRESLGALSLTICGHYHVTDIGSTPRNVALRMLLFTLFETKFISKKECSRMLSVDYGTEKGVKMYLIAAFKDIIKQSKKTESTSIKILRLAKDIVSSQEFSEGEVRSRTKIIVELFQLGLLWILSGTLRLQSHLDFIKSLRGMDPCLVAQSLLTSSAQNLLNASASMHSFDIMRQNRLGGDCASKSVPVSRIKQRTNIDITHHKKAHRRIVDRSEEKSPFSSYETTIKTIMSGLTRLVERDGLLSKFVDVLLYNDLKPIQDEIQMMKKSCEGVLGTFDIGESMSHFRDVSGDLELGLSQCSYGFSSLLSGLHMMTGLSKKNSAQKLNFFSDLNMYPRCAFEGDGNGVPNILKKCLDFFQNGPFLLGTAKYLIGSLIRDGDTHIDSACESFDYIVRAWKTTLISNEEEMERKSSLHILREVANMDALNGADIVKGMEEDEESDFIGTFNPMTTDTEEQLLGVCDETKIGEIRENGIEDESDDDIKKLKIDSNIFWALYQRVFPSDRTAQVGTSNATEYLENMTAFSKQLHTAFQRVPLSPKEPPSVWNIICADATLCHFSAENNGNYYNFYKSSNVSELTQASSLLRSLLRSITKIQETAFRETAAHPVLEEVSISVERLVKSVKANTPLSFVVVGIENVLRKADEWHRLFATKSTRVDSDTDKLSRLVIRWRKLEMSSWTFLLQERRLRCSNQSSKWFFLLYDVIINHSISTTSTIDDWRKEILNLVDQFLRSSPLGEFAYRIRMVMSLSKHLSVIMTGNDEGTTAAQTLLNVASFYTMYIPGMEEAIDTLQKPIFKKLEEFRKLVTWTATEDLGSSQKMSKEKNKFLEYYRLKAASEKTRRRLHKLCLDIDAVLRKPCYDYLSKEVGKIGYKTLASEDSNPLVNSAWSAPFSKKIPLACESLVSGLKKEMLPKEKQNHLRFDQADGFLSRIVLLEAKMSKFGKSISEHNDIAFIHASSGVDHLRNTIKQRVPELRAAEGQNIQMKQRSLVELLRSLRRLGLSPFGFASSQGATDLSTFFSVSRPTKCTDFNDVANSLLMSCVRQVRRVHEVYDARLRNSDISRDEASKAVSFCNQLLLQSSQERQVISTFSENLSTANNLIVSLETLYDQTTDESLKEFSFTVSQLEKLKNDLRRLRNIGEDFAVFDLVLKSIKSKSNLPSHCADSDDSSSNRAVSLRKHLERESADDLKKIANGIASCCTAIRDVVDNNDAEFVRDIPSKATSLHREGVISSCKRILSQIRKLTLTLKAILSSVAHLSSANALNLLLQPTLTFLERCRMSDSAKDVNNAQSADDRNIESLRMKEKANQIIERILISTQRLLIWTGINFEEKGRGENADVDGQDDDSELKKNSIAKSHRMLKSLLKVSDFAGITALLSENEAHLEKFSRCITHIETEKRQEIIDIQRTLGRFVRQYMNFILAPVFEKCAQYHCNALSLLRTLSSLTAGLFVDGYCRPAEEMSDQIDGGDHEVSGTGFGDAGDGDMSTAQNVSEEIEDEEQLIGLQNEGDENQEKNQEENNEEDGFEMTTDFEGQLEDAPDKDQGQNDEKKEDEDEDEMEKQLGGQEKGKEMIDEKLWGSEDERADEVEEEDGKGSGEEQQASSDLVANEKNDETEKERKTEKSKTLKEKGQEGGDNEDDDEGEEGGNDEPEDGSQANGELDDKNNEDEEAVPQKKKGSDGKPLGDGEEDTDKDEEKSDEAGDDRQSGPENGESEPNGQIEHEQTETKKGEDANDEDDGKDGDGDVEMGIDGAEGEQGGDQEGDGEDEAMVGDTSRNPEQGAGREDEGEDEKDEDLGDGEGDLDLGDLSSNQGDEADSVVDDGDMDVDDSGDGEGDGEDLPNGEPNKPEEDEEDVSKTMELADGTATTTQTGGDGHQAFQAEAQTMMNLNAKDNSLSEEQASNAMEGNDDTTGDQSGGGQGDKNFGGDDSNEDNNNEALDSSAIQDPNPLRTMADRELLEKWENILDSIKQATNKQEDGGVENSGGNEDTNTLPESKEFEFGKDGDGEDKMALGAATEEQHNPLPMDYDKENNEEEQKNETDNANDSDRTLSKATQQAQKGEDGSEEEKNGDSDKENEATRADEASAAAAQVEGNDGTNPLQQHPARQAAQRRQNEDNIDMDSMDVEKRNGEGMDEDNMELDREEEEEVMMNDLSDVPNDIDYNKGRMESLSNKEACELWRQIDAKVAGDANVLCEELRLVLEATERSGMGGGYRSGKRLNMRKVIEFVASDFRKDRIWMRRVRAERRAYDVMLAIDDSASMGQGGENGSSNDGNHPSAGVIALEAVSLVMSALGKLEVGRVAVTSFGSTTQAVRDFDSPLPMSVEDGAAMLKQFTFSQQETDVVDLLRFVSERMGDGQSGTGATTGGDEQRLSLVLIVSDGHVSRREEVRRMVRMLKERRVLVGLVILDSGGNVGAARKGEEERGSIFDVKRVEYDDKGNIDVVPYMHQFPVPFYVVVQNVRQLPRVMADSLRNWIEMASF